MFTKLPKRHKFNKQILLKHLGPKGKLQKNNGPSNPAIFNEFAAAAYRMGHSQLKSFIQ
jgi:hypothetical protein